MPSRLVLIGVEGIGKTSFAAFAPEPLIVQSRGESGLETLIDAGQLAPTDHLDNELAGWQDAMELVESIAAAEAFDYKTLVFDTLNGIEALLSEYVLNNSFQGDRKDFENFGTGSRVAAPMWTQFLSTLDRIRSKHSVGIIGLCHTRVRNFRNPEGADFDRYEADMSRPVWGVTSKWADIVLFYNYHTEVLQAKSDRGDVTKRGKGAGGTIRVLYTQRTAAYDAKNRHGLPEEITAGNSPEEAWNNFRAAMTVARNGKDK